MNFDLSLSVVCSFRYGQGLVKVRQYVSSLIITSLQTYKHGQRTAPFIRSTKNIIVVTIRAEKYSIYLNILGKRSALCFMFINLIELRLFWHRTFKYC